jgi:hypothetical protein
LAAAEHLELGTSAGKSMAEVIHEIANSAATPELLAEI